MPDPTEPEDKATADSGAAPATQVTGATDATEETEAAPRHVLAPANSGRAKCRGCGSAIEKGSLRFGEQVENPYTDKYTTLWFHPPCAAYKRPEALMTVEAELAALPDAADLVAIADRSMAHRRIARLDAIERAASGRAACRHCKDRIEKDSLRIKLVYFEAGRFEPSGFLHTGCAQAFCEVDDPQAVLAPLRHFNANLEPEAWQAVETQLTANSAP